jgi:hypothetical protein
MKPLIYLQFKLPRFKRPLFFFYFSKMNRVTSPKHMPEVYRLVSGIVLRRLPLAPATVTASGGEDLTVKDTRRKPTELLYLLVKKPRKHHAWQFPQGGQEKDETAAEAALRELREECGSDLQVRLVDSTSPIGIYQYKFPIKFVLSQKRTDNSIGAKVIYIIRPHIINRCSY